MSKYMGYRPCDLRQDGFIICLYSLCSCGLDTQWTVTIQTTYEGPYNDHLSQAWSKSSY